MTNSLPDNLVDCSELSLTRDIPLELQIAQGLQKSAQRDKEYYKKAFQITIGAVAVYATIKTIRYVYRQYQKKQKSKV